MENVKVNIDVNQAIEQIADKIGTTAPGIIEKYSTAYFVDGMAWFSICALISIPMVIFTVSLILKAKKEKGFEDSFSYYMAAIVPGFIAVIFLLIMANNIEYIISPETFAIRDLISQLNIPR